MFAPTEYLMIFAATYSFFCVVLTRETWIWYGLVTFFNSWVTVNSSTVLAVYPCTDCPLHVIRKKLMPSSSCWVWMNIFPWYRGSCLSWMDRINLLNCYWKAKIHYFRSLGEVAKRSELIWQNKCLIPFARKWGIMIQFSGFSKRTVKAFWALGGCVQLFSVGPLSNPADDFTCGSSCKGVVVRACFVI